jgi:hypothetical protein
MLCRLSLHQRQKAAPEVRVLRLDARQLHDGGEDIDGLGEGVDAQSGPS